MREFCWKRQFCIKQDIPSSLPYTTQAKTSGFPNGITAKQLWDIIVDLQRVNSSSNLDRYKLIRANSLFVECMSVLAGQDTPQASEWIHFNSDAFRKTDYRFDYRIWLFGQTDLLDLMFGGDQSLRDAHSHLS